MFKQYFEEYQTRLRTFTFETWPFKEGLKPPKLAQMGYYCKEGYLFCVACNCKFIIDDLLMPSDLILQKALNTHDRNCPETIIKFKITSEFMHSYGLAYYEECLSTWKEEIPIKNTYIDKVPKEYHYLVQETCKILAIFGWRKQSQFLVCKYCGRECELQNDQFDVFNEHRYFCKWANERSDQKYGYMIVLSQLMDQSVEVQQKDTEYGTVRQTIQQQTEEIVKISIQRNQELQNIKENISPIKELLAKRKRFDIAECEKERLEFEAELQKKVKLQKDQLEIQRQEQLKALYQNDHDDEEENNDEQDDNQQNPLQMNIEIDQKQNDNDNKSDDGELENQVPIQNIQVDYIERLSFDDGPMQEENIKILQQNQQNNQQQIDLQIQNKQDIDEKDKEVSQLQIQEATKEEDITEQQQEQINTEMVDQIQENNNQDQQVNQEEEQQNIIDEQQNIEPVDEQNKLDREKEEQEPEKDEKEKQEIQIQQSDVQVQQEEFNQIENAIQKSNDNDNEIIEQQQMQIENNEIKEQCQRNDEIIKDDDQKIEEQKIELINNQEIVNLSNINEEQQNDNPNEINQINQVQYLQQVESEIQVNQIENDLILQQNQQTEEQKQQINTIINLEEIVQQQQEQQDINFSNSNSESPQQQEL